MDDFDGDLDYLNDIRNAQILRVWELGFPVDVWHKFVTSW